MDYYICRRTEDPTTNDHRIMITVWKNCIKKINEANMHLKKKL